MAYDKKQYVRVNWKNKPSTATPLDEVNLNNMDNFLNVVDNTLIQFEAQKLNIATANSMIASLTIDTDSGIITAKQLDGTTFTWDLNIEKIPVSFSLSEDGILTMITEDGTEWTCDIAELIKEYVFDDSETIAFTREISEEDGSIHIGAAVKEGSIKSEHLNPDYRADIQEYTNQAEQAANESLSFSKDAKRWAVGDAEYPGSDKDNSKYYKELAEAAKTAAEQARDEAQAVADIKVMAPGVLGIGKPDNTTIEVASDGTISAKEATSTSPGISRPDGTTLGVEEGVMKMIADATSLLITDNQELVVEKVGDVAQKTTTQLLIDTIAQKVANELVTNSALTTTLANYVTKAMMSNVQVNDQNKVPSSALVYGMNEDISELNSNLNGTKFFHSFSEIGNYDTLAEYLEAMPNNSILITDKTVDSESFGLPHSGTNTFLSVFVRKINNIRIDCECVSFFQQILKEKYVAFTGSSQSYVCDWKKVVINTDYTVYNIACSYGPSINLFKFGNDAIKAIKVQGYLNQQLLSTQKYTLATNDNLKSKVNWYKNVLIGTGGKDTIGYLEISPNGDLNLKPAVNLASGTGIHFMEYYV